MRTEVARWRAGVGGRLVAANPRPATRAHVHACTHVHAQMHRMCTRARHTHHMCMHVHHARMYHTCTCVHTCMHARTHVPRVHTTRTTCAHSHHTPHACATRVRGHTPAPLPPRRVSEGSSRVHSLLPCMGAELGTVSLVSSKSPSCPGGVFSCC